MLHNVVQYHNEIQKVLGQMRPGHELEWRLGHISHGQFTSDISTAERLLELPGYKFTHTVYQTLLYPGGVRVRDGNAEIKSKIAECTLDYLPVAVRLSLASETPTAPPAFDLIPTGTRDIDRWTAPIKSNSGGSELMVSRVGDRWEVEIEFTTPPKTADEALAPLLVVLAHVLVDRPNEVSRADIVRAAADFNREWESAPEAGFLRRIGYKPLNFIPDDCELLLHGNYSATNKLDGSRYALLCSAGKAFAVSEVDAIYLGDSPVVPACDGEWDPHDQQLLLFDMITRGSETYPERMAAVAAVAKRCAIKRVRVKAVEHGKSALGITERVIDGARQQYGASWAERNDGIIYIPTGESYLASKDRVHRTLKWKFPDKISVDPRLHITRETDSERTFECFAQDVGDRETLVKDMTITMTRDDPEWPAAKDGLIAEVGLDQTRFYVMRMRPDKTHANFITVITETLKDMRNPFSLDQLLARLGKSTRTKGGSDQLVARITDAQVATAREWVATDRQEFFKAYSVVLQFCQFNKLKLSNPKCLLDGQMPNIINVYCADGLRTANDLSNKLFAINPIVFMKTVVPYAEFEISLLNRQIVRIFVYPRVRHIHTEQLFKSVPLRLADFDLYTLSADIELIAIYHHLYQPFPDRWPDALELADHLEASKPAKSGGSGGSTNDTDITEVRSALYAAMEFIDLGVLIGHWAFAELTETPPADEKVQILIGITPEAMCERIESVLRDVTPVKLQWKTEDPMIPEDIHIRRTTYYYEWRGKRVNLADTFNSLEYEIVPRISGRVKKMTIGNPYVLQRFFMIDRWMLSVLEQGKYITTDIANRKRSRIFDCVKRLREPAFANLNAGDDYVGIYKDLAIERRRVLKQEEKFRPYKPLEYITRFGKLRVMGGDE